MEKIESIQNPKVKMWSKLLTKKGRVNEGLFLVEGEHLVEEAIKAKMSVHSMIVQEEVAHKYSHFMNSHYPVYVVSAAIMRKITDTESPQGISAVLEMKKQVRKDYLGKDNVVLIVDALQDPGNLGTIIRTADAAGISAVILGQGTVDLYNPKTIRSTMGSIFHIPIIEEDLYQMLPLLQEHGYTLIATSLEGSLPYDQPCYEGAVALVIGNEANGVSATLLGKCDVRVKIPLYGQAESLNAAVATGIMLYEVIRQRKIGSP